ncbi:PGAP1-domain-containing protein [Dichomitus squalens]|uniref:GPI inositol-deacylase n=1 Tax=Dichomitus squalens TaxID=114155 RepID=A0A4Q9MY49_9APHY|nr:PGAP1-domain-containing protein [Dichomitus squalens]
MSRLLAALTLFSLLAVALLYFAGLDTYHSLSPQGCRMSWMWPSYVLQNKFDHTWTPLARRYSLWLYREGNLESNELHGVPVLFIPGNAGSSHQVRSIASSAAHQYYSAPYQVSPEFTSKGYTGLDFFAVEYNEDLSAFHGPTIDSETAYAARAIDYILSLYPAGTSVIVMGHSMGGIVATALLPNPNISTIITMSTPHTLPPVRFDRRIDHIYANNHKLLASDPTPILSLCGGATDLMIPSESCVLSSAFGNFSSSVYRRTVFSSALEGCWTGVGHLAMVWCHQVRWRVARAALEIAAAKNVEGRAAALDLWLRDGHTLPPVHVPDDVPLRRGLYHSVPPNQHLLVRDPDGSQTYLLPFPKAEEGRTSLKFVLYASQGSIPPVSPRQPLPFQAAVRVCKEHDEISCSPLTPSTFKLIPSPIPGSPFPVPGEGADESEGVVLFEADVALGTNSYVAVTVENGDKRGWIFGGFAETEPINIEVGLTSLLVSSVDVAVPSGIRWQLNLPNLPANSLVVYRLTPRYDPNPSCTPDAVLLPLLTHQSHPSETHYFPLAPSFSRRILLHSHSAAPYIASDHPSGHVLTIHSSGECRVSELELSVDWWATIGRWGTRYGTAAACWAVGIVAALMWDTWRLVGSGALIPDVRSSLDFFARKRLPYLVIASYFISFIPLRVGIWLGNGGSPHFASLATLLLPITFGLVCVMWWLLLILLWPLQRVLKIFGRRKEEPTLRRPTTALLSMGLIFLVIFILVPWQVAFLGCWLIHFYTCASSLAELSSYPSPVPGTEAVPLVPVPSDPTQAFIEAHDDNTPNPPTPTRISPLQQTNAQLHLLLFMTWLLPLVAPVLAVWVRTLATAGLTTPFDGDHNFLYVAPFLVLVEVFGSGDASIGIRSFFGSERQERVSPRWGMAALALVAFFTGPRTTYMVFETASVAMGWTVMRRIAPMYWSGRT